MRDLIVFGEDFGGLPSSTQHIVKYLSHSRKVLWVNSIGLRRPKLCKKDLFRVVNKLTGRSAANYNNKESVSQEEQITVANIRTFPAPKYTWERQLAKTVMSHQLRPLIESLELNDPILWTSLPTAADLCGELSESKVVYYCGDDFGALAGVDHDTVLQHEEKLTEKSDLILVASEKMQDKFPKVKTQMVRHGVDYRLFSTPADVATDLPQGKPIVGFYGSLSEWLDIDLIASVAQQMQNWNFVFIGPQEKPFPELESLHNVYLLGPKAHHLLPRYSQHWDMSWLPFKDNAQIRACSPLKLMEYIAAGTPIAATPFNAANPYLNQINLVNSSEDMIQLLNHPSEWNHPQPVTVADESWQQRAQFVSWLLELL